jgi:thiol-disulfide isomerase/thioredoxin
MRLSYLMGLLLICSFWVQAQDLNEVAKPLNIGDVIPDITIDNIQNYRTSQLKFSELRGKVVILDFWSVTCAGCIKQFPKLEALQKKFGDRLQILLVNKESKDKIQNEFFNRRIFNPSYRNAAVNLPSISSDRLLHKLFPHVLIPHEVWIDASGKVMAFTDGESVTGKNVQNVLDGYFDLPLKKDLLSYQRQDPLLPQIIDSNRNRLQYYSCLIRGVSGLLPSLRYKIDSASNRFIMTRSTIPILMLYSEALSKGSGFADPYKHSYFDYGKRVILEVADRSRYIYDSSMRYNKWFEENCYAYEMVIPLEQKEDRYSYIVNDLNRYFGINGRIEKRKMRCLSIVRTSTREKFKYVRETNYLGAQRWLDTSNVFHFRSTTFKVFRMTLSDHNKNHPLPITDDTGYNGFIQMDIVSPLNDITALRMELRSKYDLDIVEKVKEVDVMILTEKRYKK